jgi:hypothetical protein
MYKSTVMMAVTTGRQRVITSVQGAKHVPIDFSLSRLRPRLLHGS